MNEPRKPLVLTKEQRESALWKILMEHFERRLLDKRLKNDGPLSEVETASIRGGISELKSIMLLNNEPITQD